jgi:spore coat polysaccharide biosynthesis protein SpsF
MPVTAAIVQARLSSSRLPGKVLLSVGAKTLLARCLARVATVPGVDVVCVATALGADSERIAAEAQACGAEVFAGSEHDVLSRYAGAARYLGADVVLRITSDCPFVDPRLAGEVLALVGEERASFATNNAPASFPYGVDCEAFTMDWLSRAHREARSLHEREHVSPFIRSHPEARRVSLIERAADPFALSLRWAVDRAEDLAFARAALLDDEDADARYETLVDLLASRPDIVALNAMWSDPARLCPPPDGFRVVTRATGAAQRWPATLNDSGAHTRPDRRAP